MIPGQIFLFGSNRLQLELMSLFLQDRAQLPCTLPPALNLVPRTPEVKHLILYDGRRWNSEISDPANLELRRQLNSNFLVLINMDSAAGAEIAALAHGVRGFLYEQDDAEILLKMVHSVLGSELWVSRNVMTEYIQANNKSLSQGNNSSLGLTAREIEVLSAIGLGKSNEAIAETLCISPHTVKTHVYHIFKKINVSSRIQAANWSSHHL